MASKAINLAKHAIRERVWARLDQERAVHPPGAHGRIPNFVAADAAADRLRQLPVWHESRVIKAVPDKPQQPVRARALKDGKLVYMAVPRLAAESPFYELDPARLAMPFDEAASSKVAAAVAPTVGLDGMRPVDLIVCGSVAVNRTGARLGKGAGYSDIEVALLHQAGLIGPDTTIVTTVHALQVLDEPLPETAHDFRVDVIVTPDEVITCAPRHRPHGILWDDLSLDKIAAIPVLAELDISRRLREV